MPELIALNDPPRAPRKYVPITASFNSNTFPPWSNVPYALGEPKLPIGIGVRLSTRSGLWLALFVPFGSATLLEVRLQTGKRNQIRIQAQLHCHPLVGERLYAPRTGPPSIPFGRQALHAYRLAFRHPADGRLLRFEAPLAADMAGLVERLRGAR
jgi:hypothetical protein